MEYGKGGLKRGRPFDWGGYPSDWLPRSNCAPRGGMMDKKSEIFLMFVK
jgi:hypothetical protein